MLNKKKSYHLKLLECGNIIEYFEYELPVKIGVIEKRKKNRLKVDIEKNLKSVAYRAKVKVIRSINCNMDLERFLTLTFANDVSYNIVLLRFKMFVKRLRIRFGFLKYICVPEYTKKGRLHYHILYNLPFIPHKTLFDIWGYGFIFINKTLDINELGFYITKYMTKDFCIDKIKNRKLYFVSRNLLKPVVYCDDDVLEYFNQNSLSLVNKTEFEVPFLGKIKKLTYYKI